MTSMYGEDSPLAKLCEVCSYLVDRLDDDVQEIETGEKWTDKIIYPYSLGHRALFSYAKNGCGICTHLVEDLDQEELEEMSTRDKTSAVTLLHSDHQLDSSSSAVIAAVTYVNLRKMTLFPCMQC